jgi:hypothetical protein
MRLQMLTVARISDGTLFTGRPSPTRASCCIALEIGYFRPFMLDDS